ncbi:hypothetical protein [Hymenobacter sediminicola]|uniref:Translocation/assembly module TamB domain-containing protein n=1 Tax=Hymenobacter sediminicola TaxID=2761579 RepID=A0A7G7W8R9_9BACT|nr:hypothetical protein [Hymenobacter sediminicola]QNH62762.1 hypothetical protein H4317_02770 [Hymenobacter sediminicola]
MKQSAFGWLCAMVLTLSAPALAQQTKPQQPAKTQPAGTPAPVARFTGKLSTDPAQFMQDVQLMMAATNNAAAKNTAAKLQQLWASNKLTATQQGNIVTLSQQMLTLGYKARPHLEALFNAVVAGATVQNFSDKQMDEFLDVATKTVRTDPGPEAAKFLSSAAQFLDTKVLFTSRYNTLRVIGGTFSFAYNDQDMPSMAPAAAPVAAPPAAAVVTQPLNTKPGAKTPAKKAAPKKRKSDGWDSADLWSSSGGSGWGDSNDGWGTPAKKTPAKTTPAKAGATPAAKEPEPAPAFEPAPYFDSYVAPPTRGPVLVLKDADLFMSTGGDSITIKKTSGAVVPQTGKFVGYGGQYGWQVNGNPATADLTTYDFDLNKAEFTAEPVTLTYPAVLETPVKGALSYKSLKKKPGAADSGYPRFISLTNDARVKNIGENIRYYGGFSLAGSRVLSAALDGSLSRIFVDLDGKPKFRASSRAYVLGDSLITAERASVTIFEDKIDSLTHPGVKLKYTKKGQVLQLAREAGLYKSTPYFDSYHQMEITAEMLSWPIRTPDINFSMLTAKNQVTANFESKEFYTNTRYQQIKSINKLHPLQMVVGYSAENGNKRRFTVQEVADFRKLKPENVRSAAAGLARDGYVDWNPQTQQITLRPKATHYVNSSRGKKDYDHIAIKSLSPSGKNATLNLNTNDLIVRGVDRFNFSDDSVTVFVKPDSSIIRIQKNRGILFNGTVVASSFVFKGKEFKFDYDGFFIDLAQIDSIIVKGKGSKGSVMKARKDTDFTLTNKKKTSTGKLYINHPNNKSGRKKLGAYPSFDATTGAYVYFDKPEVLGGAYDTTVYFDIPPFKLDSLNNKNRSAVGFKGTFVSGGIVPDLKTKLVLQDDGSLGFTYDLPKEGVPVYGGKGRLFNKVKMSNRGIQGIGDIKYLTSTLSSDQFIFYKDSVVTVGKAGTILPGPLNGTEFTKVTLPAGYQMKWAVKQDSMYLSTQPQGLAMKMYGDQYGFKGTATLTPGGLYGDGGVDGPQSFIRSTQIAFKPTSYTGKKSTLSIKSAEPNKPALTANNVAFSYDVKNGNTSFAREEGDSKSSIDLPYSDYRTTLSGGKWDFKKKLVQLKVAPGADSTRSYFYSTKPDQKGLKFRAATGQYDLTRYRLIAGGVPRIAAADAWIEPDSNKVYILANAQMRTFQNAGIVMDTLAKFHNLYKGEIKVLSRTAFTGNALYSYKNASADSFAIKFANFQVDSTAMLAGGPKGAKKGGLLKKGNGLEDAPPSPATMAVASIDAKDKFHLAPRIAYRGGVNMNSKRRGFIFDGQGRLEFSKVPTAADWFAVQDSIDPKAIRLRIPDPVAPARNKADEVGDASALFTGLFMSEGTGKVYPLYAGPKLDIIDRNLFQVGGYLSFNQKKGIYTIANHDLTDPNIYEGSVLTFNDSTGGLSFRGKLNLINSNKDYGITASGVGTAKPDSNRYDLDTFMAFDINMPEKAVEAMGVDMATNTKGSPEALNGSQEEYYKLGEFLGSKAVQSYSERRGKYEPLQKISPKMLHTVVLNKVDLRWSEKFKAWYSVGKIGLVSIGKKDLNVLIDGHIEIHKGDNNTDEVNLYLEAEPQTWYFMKYSGTAMLAKAQHGSFDEIIGRAAKGDYNTATQYGFYLGDDQEVQQYLVRFRRDYLKEDPKKKRAAPVSAASQSTGNFDFDQDASKKKKKKGNEPAFDADGMPIEEVPVDKKKKNKKETAADPNDPFGGGDAGAAPAEAPKKKEKKADPVADEPAPAEDTSKKKKEKAAEPAPTPAKPAATPEPAATEPSIDPKQAKKEEERKAKEAEKLKKEEEKKAKEEEKKKKANENDPFGGS